MYQALHKMLRDAFASSHGKSYWMVPGLVPLRLDGVKKVGVGVGVNLASCSYKNADGAKQSINHSPADNPKQDQLSDLSIIPHFFKGWITIHWLSYSVDSAMESLMTGARYINQLIRLSTSQFEQKGPSKYIRRPFLYNFSCPSHLRSWKVFCNVTKQQKNRWVSVHSVDLQARVTNIRKYVFLSRKQ